MGHLEVVGFLGSARKQETESWRLAEKVYFFVSMLRNLMYFGQTGAPIHSL